MTKRFLGILIAAASLAFGAPASAQEPLHVIVPLPPGGGDLLARMIATPLAEMLGKPLVVENKPGADGAIGGVYVKRAKPDGNTIFFATNSPLCAVPALRKSPPYDPVKDFSPISLIGVAGFFLLSNADLPIKSVKDLVAYAKANPGKLKAGVSNSSSLFALSQLINVAKIKVIQANYAGDAKAIPALASGEVDILFATITSARGLIQAGKLRVLATTLPKRSKSYLDVPTLQEEGMGEVSISPWIGFFGPAGMPKEIVDKYAAATAKVLEIPAVRERLESLAINVESSTPEQLSKVLKENLDVTKRVVEESNIPKT